MNLEEYLSELEEIVARAPKTKTGELAAAMFTRVSTFLSNNPGKYFEKLKDPYLKAYLLAELPAYKPDLWPRSMEALKPLLPALNATRKVFVLSRLAETSKALRKDYERYIREAHSLLPESSWKGRSRLVISLANLGLYEEAIALSQALKPPARAVTLAEASALNPGNGRLLMEGMESVKKVSDPIRRIVAVSRLLKSYRLADGYSAELLAEKIVEKLLPVATEIDAFVALLVARNLAEAPLHTAALKLYSSTKGFLRNNFPIDGDVEELLVHVALRIEGLSKALDLAMANSSRNWYLAPSLLNYAITSGYLSRASLEVARAASRDHVYAEN
jgi:hypothetical protein